jgi:hypothetical protein
LGITDPDPIKPAGKTDLAAAIKENLGDTAKAKSKRTLYAYTRTLKMFVSTPRSTSNRSTDETCSITRK